jgi:hypothetical protein
MTKEELIKKGAKPVQSTGMTREQLVEKGAKTIGQKTVERMNAVVEKPGFLQRTAQFLLPKKAEGFGETLGTVWSEKVSGEPDEINENMIAEAESRFQLAKLLNNPKTSPEQKARIRKQLAAGSQIEESTKQMPALNKTGRDVASEALGTLGTAALAATAPGGVAGRIGFGGLVGAGAGAKKGLEEGKGVTGVAKETLKGGAVGAAVSGAFEGVAFGLGKLFKNTFQPGKVYNRELTPPKKEVANDIAMGFKTFGQKASEVVDDAGKPVYVGGYDKMLTQATKELDTQGKKLMTLADKYSDIKMDRSAITKNVIEKIQDEYGMLKPSELKLIQQEIGRIDKLKFNPKQAIEYKRLIDSKIPDNFWEKMASGDRSTALATYTKYLIRDSLRNMVNEATGDAGIQAINNRLALAMDMKKLTAFKLAADQTKQLPRSIGGFISDLLDKTLLHPGVTTRAAQTIKKVGPRIKNLPQTAPTAITESMVTE